MSVSIINRTNTDVTDLNVEQTGSYRTDVFLEEPLLDSTKDYMVSCSALAIPMSSEPMITHDVTVQDLLTVRRRKHAAAPNTAADELDLGGTETLTLEAGNRIYCLTDFVSIVANWCTRVSNAIADLGLSNGVAPPALNVNQVIAANHAHIDVRIIGGVQLLTVGITSSATVRFTGSSVFWDNFYITSNNYAFQLLGLPYSDMLYTRVGAEVTADSTHLIAGGVIATPAATLYALGNTRTNAIQGTYTLLRFLEERLYVALEVDLALPWNIVIRNGKELRTHQMATFPIKTSLISTIESSNSQVLTDVRVETNSNVGRIHFSQKSDPTAQWYPLASSYAIQNTRLMVHMMRRRYRLADQTWYFDAQPLNIHKDAVWNASLKFVSVF
jgi:hypothetical protein